jgi:hypothetical protein
MNEGVNEISAALKESITTLDEVEKIVANLSMAIQNEYQNRQLSVQ